MSIMRELRNALHGAPCAVFSSDMRVRILATGLCTYPDGSVVFGRLEVDPGDKNTITNPVVLVEVLSTSTEAYDREDKRAHYRLIPSLRDFLLVSQRERRIEQYHRNDDGTWTLRDARAGGNVRLDAIGCEISVDAVYDDPLAAAAQAAPRQARSSRRVATRSRRVRRLGRS
jgi:Uma2 family endonuclease